MTLIVATCLWDANEKSQDFSRCYDETWVEKLYWGFRRNLTVPFDFICFVDRIRPELIRTKGINQIRFSNPTPSYADCIEPYRLDRPMILVGLDTIVTGKIDHLAGYCLGKSRDAGPKAIALPRDPNATHQACNGVALVPAGNASVYWNWRGENDMVWMRQQPHVFIDDLFPWHVRSYKNHIRATGLLDTRIVYFHGQLKPHERAVQRDNPWIAEHWRIGL